MELFEGKQVQPPAHSVTLPRAFVVETLLVTVSGTNNLKNQNTTDLQLSETEVTVINRIFMKG